ncbi:KpsF/GutQ family sugar-phosphate isomerase [Thermanaerovibrio acidaminovorans]|jgi:arabinose-5-phosphate isomerase|uniref:KpsF/GutQ family protein n=1 Tax=Thermanaerovibrio acidaminovorans (strain ATCC 49978 / DSM 6589 / Su883) TaxID=525903 RepID=D1B671_THEAS|nr:KpsF/GutQ family protein [Thermanaerovibrio acidaminovorans DSM 6589]
MMLPYERDLSRVGDLELLEVGLQVIRQEARALEDGASRMGLELVRAARMVASCSGRVVVCGLGKSGLIGRKIAATLASLGCPAFFLHAAEGSHGDLGMVCRDDVGLFLSNSGTTREVLEMVPFFRRIGCPVIALTGRRDSPLGLSADVVLDCSVGREADPLGIAPTSSTTLQLAVGDALAGMVTRLLGLRVEDFALFHPGGALGRRLLLRLEDVMAVGDRVPRVSRDASVKEALFAITDKGYGAVAVEGPSGELVGIFTDGDLRRLMEREGVGSLERPVGEVMTRNPKVMGRDKLAAEALKLMEEMEISVVLVVDGARVEGIVHLHDLLKAGVA